MVISTEEEQIKQQKAQLFEYWSNISAVTIINQQTTIRLIDQPVRATILNILREGIDDIHPLTLKKARRFALSVNEIQRELKKSLESDIKLSNIYFHLQKLTSGNEVLVKEIASVKEGRYNTTYYGRTAKLFLYGSTESEQERFEFYRLLNKLFNNSDSDENFSQKMDLQYQQSVKLVQSWLVEHNEAIAKSGISIMKLYRFLTQVAVLTNQKDKFLLDIAKNLGFSDVSDEQHDGVFH